VSLCRGAGDFKNLVASREIDGLRLKIESFRLEHAKYPPAISQVTGASDAWGRPYIYRTIMIHFISPVPGPTASKAHKTISIDDGARQ